MSRLFYYLSDAMRANARQKVSSTAHKIGSAWMRALSISFGLGKGIRRVRVLRTISAGNLLSQVGLARNLASRVAMLLQSDKNQAEIRPPLGRRAVHRSKWGGGGGGAGEREKKTSGTGQLSNKPDCKRVQTRGGRTHFRDLSRYSSASTLHTFMQISNARVYPRRVGMQKFTRSAPNLFGKKEFLRCVGQGSATEKRRKRNTDFVNEFKCSRQSTSN